jgi:hypothetical protein
MDDDRWIMTDDGESQNGVITGLFPMNYPAAAGGEFR